MKTIDQFNVDRTAAGQAAAQDYQEALDEIERLKSLVDFATTQAAGKKEAEAKVVGLQARIDEMIGQLNTVATQSNANLLAKVAAEKERDSFAAHPAVMAARAAKLKTDAEALRTKAVNDAAATQKEANDKVAAMLADAAKLQAELNQAGK